MSKVRLANAIVPFALWLAAMASTTSSCTDFYINGTCGNTDDCLTVQNYAGEGAVCVEGFCACPQKGVACCPDGSQVCPQKDYKCRPESDCVSRFLALHGCEPKTQCASDAECPGPPDARCGVGRCIAGLCQLDIRTHKPIESQFPGDCKINLCSPGGSIMEVFDPSDIPYDANPCTFDACDLEGPYRKNWPDRTPCPNMEPGICVNGWCQDCSSALGVGECPGSLVCQEDRCVPPLCTDNALNGQETSFDCGGPECRPCELNLPCMVGSDCLSGICEGGLCQEGTHSDGVKNAGEVGVDCGYFDGPPYDCANGQPCITSSHCESHVCFGGICQAESCTDAVQNGTETGVDCGGPCSPCPA